MKPVVDGIADGLMAIVFFMVVGDQSKNMGMFGACSSGAKIYSKQSRIGSYADRFSFLGFSRT
jgi:hypothetical protein